MGRMLCSSNLQLIIAPNPAPHPRQIKFHTLNGIPQAYKSSGSISISRRSGITTTIHLPRAAFDADLSEQVSGQGKLRSPLQVALGLGLLLGFDRACAGALQWQALPAGARSLPSSTTGMISLFSFLLLLDRFSPESSRSITSFFSPTVEFIQRWMPVFYAPALAMLPVSLRGVQVLDGVKALFLLVSSWAGTLLFTAFYSSSVRRFANTRLEEAPSMFFSPPFSIWESLPWLAIGAAGFMIAYVSPAALRTPARTLLPFLFSSTVVGFLLGSFLPGPIKRFIHPVITCAVFVNAAMIFYSISAEQQYLSVLGLYFTNNMKDPGAGDVLMAFLRPLAVSYGFLLYRQRRMIFRHKAEIASVVPVAGIFSLILTRYVAGLLTLSDELTKAVIPSNLTFAFALPVSQSLQANTSLVITCCVITGVIGANLSRLVLKNMNDLVARGLAGACSSHGYGSASIASGEADLLPLCAVSYILMGAFCSLLCATPPANMLTCK